MAGWYPVIIFQGVITVPDQPQQMDAQQMMQVMQQKLGNLEITLHALLSVLEEEDIVDQETINEKAEEIVEEMQEQQGEMAEELEEE